MSTDGYITFMEKIPNETEEELYIQYSYGRIYPDDDIGLFREDDTLLFNKVFKPLYEKKSFDGYYDRCCKNGDNSVVCMNEDELKTIIKRKNEIGYSDKLEIQFKNMLDFIIENNYLKNHWLIYYYM